MTNIDLQTDLQIQELEAEVVHSFGRLQTHLEEYSNVYLKLKIEPDNSDMVKTFFNGLDSLYYAFGALNEAIKTIATIKGVNLEKC